MEDPGRLAVSSESALLNGALIDRAAVWIGPGLAVWRAAGQPQPRIELRDVVLDTRSRTVTRAGQPVALTAREYAILEYLG